MKNGLRILVAIFAALSISTASASEFGDTLDQFIQSPQGLTQVKRFLTLPENKPDLAIQSASLVAETKVSRIYQMAIDGNFVAPIRFQISVPSSVNFDASASLSKYPVVVLLSGIHTGDKLLNLINDQSEVVVISFQYPLAKPLNQQPIKDVLEGIYETPKQVAALLSWLNDQNWINKFQMHVMGISLGTLFLPLSQRIAQSWGTYINSSIFAYGGGDLKSFIRFGFEDSLDSGQVLTLVDSLQVVTAFLEPKNHYPSLQGRFLVVEGTNEDVFPTWSVEALRYGIPEPKDIRYIEGPHISSKRLDLIQKLGIEVNTWLTQLGAL